MAETLIDSPENPRVRGWRKLATAKGREAARAFLAEGPHLVEEALKAGSPVECILTDRDPGSFAFLRGTRAEVVRVSERALRSVSDAVTSQGVVAVCPLPRAEAFRPQAGRYLLLDGVQDPGNVGTMIRTASAAGFLAVITGRGCADAFAPKVVRATQGAVFHVPVVAGTLEEWIPALKEQGVECLGAAAREGRDFRTVEPGGATAIVIGSEGAGVRPEVAALCDGMVHIPMAGPMESLSAPVAAGILMFHVGLARWAGPDAMAGGIR